MIMFDISKFPLGTGALKQRRNSHPSDMNRI